MEAFTLEETGDATVVRQEKFVVHATFKNVEINESYVPSQDGANYKRKINLDTQLSEPYILGQKIDLLSSWRIRITSGNGDENDESTHVSVGWGPKRIYVDTRTIICKFKICIVDADGDVLYARNWRSSEKAQKIRTGNFHMMPDFIGLDELLMAKDFLMFNKTLHLKCEGVIYGELENWPITKTIALPRPITQLGPNLYDDWELADVELISANNESLLAHKIVLKEASPRFAYLLHPVVNAEGFVKQMETVYLEELTTDEMKKLRKFIYTGEMEQDWDDLYEVKKLIKISKDYEIPSLKQYCFLKMLNSLSITNFLDKLEIYFKNSAGRRIQHILHHFFIRHHDKFVELDRFKKFAKEQKEAFLFVALYKTS